MNTELLNILKCPVCGEKLSEERGSSLFCRGEDRQHCFDISRSGHINLVSGHGGGGDDKACAAGRTAFLGKNYYRPFSDEINSIIKKYNVRAILDAGCGEGYYTHRAAEHCNTVLGIDLSKFAIETAAKRAKREGKGNELYAIAGIFSLPCLDDSFDGIVNLFAPCCEEEFSRALKKNGILIIGAAGKEHLLGLKQAIYKNAYQNEERADLPTGMELLERRRVKFTIVLDSREDIGNLFSMTPYFYRTSREDREKLEVLSRLETVADFDIFVYKNTLKGE